MIYAGTALKIHLNSHKPSPRVAQCLPATANPCTVSRVNKSQYYVVLEIGDWVLEM